MRPRARGSLLALALPALLALAAGCGDKKPRTPSCASDRDCQDGLRCVNKRCMQCATDAHCDRGETCSAGTCVLAEGSCRNDVDCDDGQICRANRCGPCREDHECGPDRRCSGGRCLARGACERNTDCADDEDCVEGRCSQLGRDRPPDVTCTLDSVLFSFAQSALDEAARASLNRTGECLLEVPNRAVFLTGHTDPRGTEEYNIALSERRAQVVADYLARLGIDPARFRVIPKGETEASGLDESGWAEDRRVEIEWQ